MTLQTIDLNSYQDLVEYAEVNVSVERLYLKNSHFVRLVEGFAFELYQRVVLHDSKGKIFISIGRMQVRPEFRTYGFTGFIPDDQNWYGHFSMPHRAGQYDEPFCGHCGARKK